MKLSKIKNFLIFQPNKKMKNNFPLILITNKLLDTKYIYIYIYFSFYLIFLIYYNNDLMINLFLCEYLYY